MFAKTHLAVALFFILLFFSYITNPFVFLPVVFIATIIPDIDSKFSKIGRYKVFRIFNFFTKHRGIMHSFTFLFIISLIIFLFFKEIVVPFALAYSLHLLLDALTIQGISPFFPLKFKVKGGVKTGGIKEIIFFIFFIIIDLLLLFYKIYLIVK